MSTVTYSPRTRGALESLLVVWKRRLGLQQWDVELQFTELDGCWMTTIRHVAYQRAVIQVASHLLEDGPARPDDWPDVSPDDRRVETILVHELLHLYTARIVDSVDDDLDGFIHRDALSLLRACQSRAEEWMVDTLARALVEAFHTESPFRAGAHFSRTGGGQL